MGGNGGNGGCGRGAPPTIGRGYGGQPNPNCWDLHGRLGIVSAAPAEVENPSGCNEQEAIFKADT